MQLSVLARCGQNKHFPYEGLPSGLFGGPDFRRDGVDPGGGPGGQSPCAAPACSSATLPVFPLSDEEKQFSPSEQIVSWH